MPRKKEARIAIPGKSSTSNQRVKYLLQAKWNGHQSAMAKACGVTQGAISNVVNDRIHAGLRLVTQIAQSTGISADWLISGTGRPDSIPQQPTPSTISYLPVSRWILSKPPDSCSAELSGITYEVPHSWVEPGHYLLELTAELAVPASERENIRVGDLLLLGTTSIWKKNQSLDGRLCVIRSVGDTDRGGFFIDRVEVERTEVDGVAKLFVQSTATRSRSIHSFKRYDPSRRRGLSLETKEGEGSFEDSQGSKDSVANTEVDPKDIVAVVIRMIRPKP